MAAGGKRRPVAWIVVVVAAFSVSGAVSIAVKTGIPRPGVADEFSYLLSADTFARGRLANPTHPLWEHFEALHLIQRPTYSSKYPPGQGLILALGQKLGHPVVGVWLGSALMAAAITWMLLGWVPRSWALFGGVLAALLFGISGVWAQTYLPGSLTAAGGALLYGGLRRVVAGARAGRADAFWMAVGLVVLANTRPFEGLVTSLPAAAVLGVWLLRQRGDELRRSLLVVVAPMALVLGGGALWTGLHNRAVTGSAVRLPYQVHQESYPLVSLFVWQKVPYGTHYNHGHLYASERLARALLMEGNPPGIRWRSVERRLRLFRDQYLPGPTWAPLLLLPLAPRRRWILLALGSCLFVLGVQLLSVPILPHYSAPLAGLLVLLMVEGVRAPERFPRGKLAARIAAVLLLAAASAATVAKAGHDNSASWSSIHLRRPALEGELVAAGGRHLVLVEYGPDHHPFVEWVYNSAQIDGQAVVWAHSMGAWRDRRLADYYGDRQVWRLALGGGEESEARASLAAYRPPGLRESAAAIGSDDLHLALERLEKRREADVRAGLITALGKGELETLPVDGDAGARVVGVSRGGWTRATRPAAILIRNPGPVAVVPRLELACGARGEALPIRVAVDDGTRVRQVRFRRAGRRRVDLGELAAGSAALVTVSANRGWVAQGRRPRRLGVKILAVDFRRRRPGAGEPAQEADHTISNHIDTH